MEDYPIVDEIRIKFHWYELPEWQNIPPSCAHCSKHQSNGGDGICHCILG